MLNYLDKSSKSETIIDQYFYEYDIAAQEMKIVDIYEKAIELNLVSISEEKEKNLTKIHELEKTKTRYLDDVGLIDFKKILEDDGAFDDWYKKWYLKSNESIFDLLHL